MMEKRNSPAWETANALRAAERIVEMLEVARGDKARQSELSREAIRDTEAAEDAWRISREGWIRSDEAWEFADAIENDEEATPEMVKEAWILHQESRARAGELENQAQEAQNRADEACQRVGKATDIWMESRGLAKELGKREKENLEKVRSDLQQPVN